MEPIGASGPGSGSGSSESYSRLGGVDDESLAQARTLGLAASGEALDRLTEVAAKRVGAADVQVSLDALHRHLASLTGIDLPARALGELRGVTAEAGEMVAITDTMSDPRVAELEPVRAGVLRAYLGAPLVTKEGETIGALCAVDDKPHWWSEEDRGALAEVAAAVASELELARVTNELLASQARLELGFTAADVGSFDWDLRSNLLTADDRLVQMFGYEQRDFEPRVESFFRRIHPDDKERVARAVEDVRTTGGEFAVDFRVIVREGGERWVSARGRTLPGPDGKPERVLGAGFDTTGSHNTHESIRRMLETMHSAFLSVDNQWRLTYANAEAERLVGMSRQDLLGKDIRAAFPPDWGNRRAAAYHAAMFERRPVSFEAYYPPLDAWFETRIWPGPDGLAIYFLDITARRQAEAEREKANERLQLLTNAGGRMSRSLEPDTVLASLVEEIVPDRAACAVVAVTEEVESALSGDPMPHHPEGMLHVRMARHRISSLNKRLAADLVGTAPFSLGDSRGVGRVARTGRREWLPVLDEDEVVALVGAEGLSPAERRALQPRAALTVPLRSRGTTLGALLVVAPFDGELDRRLIQELAARAAVYLDNAVVHAASRQVGLTLQRALLPPRLPEPEGVALAARYQPGVTGIEVGGDFYLAQQLPGGRLLLAIGDVVGRGISAAATMGQLRSVVLALGYSGESPDEVLRRLSAMVIDILHLEFATLLLGTYDAGSRKLVVSSAGHPPPLLAPVGIEPAYVVLRPGAPLGAPPSARTTYECTEVDVPPASTLVLYTDGLIEKRGETLETGMEQLRQALVDVRLPPEAVCEHALEKTGRLGGVDDDVALLVMSHVP